MSPKRATAAVRVVESPSWAAAFDEAASAAVARPADEAPWERLEEKVAHDEQQARELLELYRAHLAKDLPKAVHEVVARRAARFAAECFGENAPESIQVLRAVLAAVPDADWAFRPLVVALTMAERWGEVLDAYDARLAARAAERRVDFLEEAARIAKDFTRDSARAIGYLDRLFRLRPDDAQAAASLERLLERDKRWDELVAMWRLRLEGMPDGEARELRLRLASALHDELGQPDAALEALRPLMADPTEVGVGALSDRLERLFGDERATADTRLGALDALRGRLETAGRAARVPELLAVAIGFSKGQRLLGLRRECGERLQALGNVAGALDQYVALAALAPEDREIEDRLRQLAELGRDPDRLARGLVAAAQACPAGERRVELLLRAARVEDRQLARKARAAALFEEAAGDEAAPLEARLEALRRLDELRDDLGQPTERLDALERLAAVEPKPGEQRLVWAAVARLSVAAGDIDRALRAWSARLDLDATDAEALAAARALLVGAERWPALIELLRKRVAVGPAAHQVRADLVEIATLARERLRDLPRAIDAWREVTARFGEDDESVGHLADLLTETERFTELAELLTRRAGVDRGAHADRLARLAAAVGDRLGDGRAAVEWYGRALEVEPAHEAARAGLVARLADAELAPRAAASLAAAAERTDSWQLLLELVPHRLAGLTGAAARARLLEEAAALAEERAGDPQRAFAWLCEALPQAGGSLALEREVLRLAEATKGHARAAEALAATIAAGALPPLPLAHLHERRGALLEEHAGDLAGAKASYAAAVALTPERLEPRRGLLRTAMLLGDVAGAAALIVNPNVSPATRESALLPLFEALARQKDRLPAALAALAEAVDAAPDLETRARRELHARIAAALLGDCKDPAGADAALGRALGADPGHVPTLRQRAELLRARPDARLLETLERLASEQPLNLDFLREAADVARAASDEPRAVDLLARLADQAMRLARLGTPAQGNHAALDTAAAAIDELVGLHAASRAPERLRLATSLLLEGARLPAAAATRHAWLRRAAQITEETLNDLPGAIRVWRMLHEEAPGDEAAREALARLYEGEQRFADAAALRVAELDATAGSERRLALRLEIVRVGGLLEQRTAPADVLRANLAERPGHAATLARLAEVLLQKGRAAELADVLEQQARTLADEGQPSASAALWAELARLVEGTLGNASRAALAWERVAELEPTAEALDALGRLALAAGEATAAASWLDRRLAMTEGDARGDVSSALATAYLAAGQRHRAVACLERALDEQPRAEALRERLVALYREAGAWEPLARALAEGCEHTSDESLLVARSREAAETYARLGLLARAVPVLERAVFLLPKDEGLRLAYADGLAQCGRRDEARAELLKLVEQAGWRKSRKRAGLHQRLGENGRAQGDLPFALEQLELASSMDASNLAILRQLAEVAEEAGALERAERAYRALLVRRDEPAGGEAAATSGLAVTEILLHLFALARKRDHAGEADELLDSAVAAAVKDPAEARRLQQGLLASGAHDVLDRLLEKRLALTAGTPAQADVHADRAESLRAQGRAADAFDAQLLAVETAPERTALHEPLVELARAAGKAEVLVDRLLSLVEKRRRKAETGVAGALLLRAAGVAERDFNDDARALELHRRAEEAEPRSVAVLAGLARLARKRGDDAECARLGARLAKVASEAATSEEAAEALYEAAALELPRAETRDAGVASLCAALEKKPDLERASALVANAGLPQADLVKILPLYERIARQSGDEHLLLDYLERRAATPSATVAEVREAVDLAVALSEAVRVEPLLLRLAELAAKRTEGRRDAAWAFLELIQLKRAAGDLEGAARALERAAEAEAVELERLLTLSRDLAERAGRAGDRRLGARLLERLHARAPEDESVWRPLLEHYVGLQDLDGLERMVAQTLPLLTDVAQRNQLRIARARVLLARDERDPAAADILRDALLDERRQPEALALLSGYYERTGAQDELLDLLDQRFEAAVEAKDREGIVEAALQLGDALAADPARAAALYERALTAVPGRPELLRRLLSRRDGDATAADARRMEELLAIESGAEAASLARQLAGIWAKLGDQAAVRRVLEQGLAQVPGDEALADELERLYRGRESWALLAGLLVTRATHETDGARAAARLIEAATLRETQLADAGAAAELLRAARARVPEDTDVVARLARLLVANGDLAAAATELAAVLARADLDAAQRVPLALLAAQLEGARGDHRAAVAVLRGALAAAPNAIAEALDAALEAWRVAAAEAQSAADLRAVTLELADRARARGDVARARQLVASLLESGEPDVETVRLAAELAEAEGDVNGAIDATYHLMRMEHGDAQNAAARRLVELAAQVERTADAVAAVEAVVAEAPDAVGLVDLLGELYEKTGELGKLAAFLYEASSRAPDEATRFDRLRRAGALAVQAGDGSTAVMALDQAHAMQPRDEETALLLSDAYILAGALAEAAELLKPLVAARKGKASPELAALHQRLARIAGQSGDAKTELTELTRALDADKRNGELMAAVADRAEAAGDLDLALKALRLISANNAAGPISVPGSFLRQARIAHRKGETERAIMFARRAEQDAPAGDDVKGAAKELIKVMEGGAARPAGSPPPPPRR
jgi:tetratricopeptide (TPR) repeat protein